MVQPCLTADVTVELDIHQNICDLVNLFAGSDRVLPV